MNHGCMEFGRRIWCGCGTHLEIGNWEIITITLIFFKYIFIFYVAWLPVPGGITYSRPILLFSMSKQLFVHIHHSSFYKTKQNHQEAALISPFSRCTLLACFDTVDTIYHSLVLPLLTSLVEQKQLLHLDTTTYRSMGRHHYSTKNIRKKSGSKALSPTFSSLE